MNRGPSRIRIRTISLFRFTRRRFVVVVFCFCPHINSWLQCSPWSQDRLQYLVAIWPKAESLYRISHKNQPQRTVQMLCDMCWPSPTLLACVVVLWSARTYVFRGFVRADCAVLCCALGAAIRSTVQAASWWVGSSPFLGDIYASLNVCTRVLWAPVKPLPNGVCVSFFARYLVVVFWGAGVFGP